MNLRPRVDVVVFISSSMLPFLGCDLPDRHALVYARIDRVLERGRWLTLDGPVHAHQTPWP